MKLSKNVILISGIVMTVVLIGAIVFLVFFGKGLPYRYSYVSEYLSQDSDVTYKVTDVERQHYDEGFTGGLYMYDFTLKGSDGNTYHAWYSSYAELSRDTVGGVELSGDTSR